MDILIKFLEIDMILNKIKIYFVPTDGFLGFPGI